jgi:hypothetical protein
MFEILLIVFKIRRSLRKNDLVSWFFKSCDSYRQSRLKILKERYLEELIWLCYFFGLIVGFI